MEGRPGHQPTDTAAHPMNPAHTDRATHIRTIKKEAGHCTRKLLGDGLLDGDAQLLYSVRL